MLTGPESDFLRRRLNALSLAARLRHRGASGNEPLEGDLHIGEPIAEDRDMHRARHDDLADTDPDENHSGPLSVHQRHPREPPLDAVLDSKQTDPRPVMVALIRDFERKSNGHERVAKWGTGIIVLVSAALPLVLLASTHWQGFAISKLVPGLLSMTAAVAAGWLQFERPYEVWAAYRSGYRDLLGHLVRYDVGAEPYDPKDQAKRDRKLACTIAIYERQIEVHRDSLMPPSDAVAGMIRSGTSSRTP